MKKVCLIYNYAQHYRKGVFQLLDQKLNCHSYFGDKMGNVKKMDYRLLKGFQRELRNLSIFPPIYWQSGAVGLLFKGYKHYILLGEYYCISTWLILIFAKFSSKKTYLWTHGWYGNENFSKRFIKKVFFGLGDEVLLYGEYAKKLMISEGFKADKLNVVYNSLDYGKQIDERAKVRKSEVYARHFNNTFPTLIFIGRLTKIKRLQMIIIAMHLLREDGFQLNFVFIGEGEEKMSLQARVREYDLTDFIWFYGSSYDEREICSLIFNAEACVSPGNVGLTAMHSLVYGTPVITHNDFANQMPEFEAIEPGNTGMFFEKDSVHDLADKIKIWLTEKTDRENVRKDCFRRIDQFYNPTFQVGVIESVVKKYEN